MRWIAAVLALLTFSTQADQCYDIDADQQLGKPIYFHKNIRPGIKRKPQPPLPLDLLPLKTFPNRHKGFPMEMPLQYENGLALLKMKFQA